MNSPSSSPANPRDDDDTYPPISDPDNDADSRPTGEIAEQISPQSHRSSSPLTYHDHSEVKEEDIGELVTQNFTDDATVTNKRSDIDQGNEDNLGAMGDEDLERSSHTSKQTNKRKSTSGPRGGVYEPFPLKLHRMLASVEEAGLSAAVSWKTHGRAFQVNHVNQFVQTILPKFFRQTKLTSFQRQLNLYGFRRIIQGADSGAYYHELFLRGRPFLCRAMVRTKIKGKSRLRASDLAGTEPDFYKMPPLPLLTTSDYKKSKNVFFNIGSDQGEVGGGNLKSDTSTSTAKRRRSADQKGFDPFDPFSDEAERSPDHQQHWGGSHLGGSYPDQSSSSMHYLDNSSMSSVSNYNSPSIQTGWPWQSLKSDKPHSSNIQHESPLMQPPQSMIQRNPPPNEQDTKRGGTMMPPTTYGMLPYSSQNMSQSSATSGAAASSYYYPPMNPSYGQQQNPMQMQGGYWGYNQYQTHQSQYTPQRQDYRNQDNNPTLTHYNMGGMQPPTSMTTIDQQTAPQRQVSLRDSSTTASSSIQPISAVTSNTNLLHQSTSARPLAVSAADFQVNMSPMKLQGETSEGQTDTIELEVDGDMKELLNAFIKKKES